MADRHPRMILSTEGMEGSGKTRLALTAPRPLWWLDFDFGLEGVEGAERVDEHRTYDMLAAEWKPEAEARRYAQDVMRRFIADFRAALAAPARSLVVDTFTASWAGQRLARSEDKYVEMEEEFNSLIRAAYASPHTNVILIHHMQRDWKRNQQGKPYKGETWSRDGMDSILNKVQFGIRQRFVQPIPEKRLPNGMVTEAGVPGRFEIDILKCRDNVGLVGTTQPGMDFPTLCSMAAPLIDWSR
jgi:hypothetical protein